MLVLHYLPCHSDAHSDNAGAEANLLDAGQESVDEQPLIESVSWVCVQMVEMK